ncbi:MAG TPA: hypothetical protein VLV28_06650 [Gaiellaceae bacterium]|nr:hypothetical protein [Gaiellaceae bacterium]
MVEYATVTAALASLVSSLSLVLGSTTAALNSTNAAALVSSAARTYHVSGTDAHAAYGHAPYHKPGLRYLYTVGWVGADSNIGACKAALLLGPDPTPAATQALKGNSKLLARLNASGITVTQAATAIARGYNDGCS